MLLQIENSLNYLFIYLCKQHYSTNACYLMQAFKCLLTPDIPHKTKTIVEATSINERMSFNYNSYVWLFMSVLKHVLSKHFSVVLHSCDIGSNMTFGKALQSNLWEEGNSCFTSLTFGQSQDREYLDRFGQERRPDSVIRKRSRCQSKINWKIITTELPSLSFFK